MAEKKNFAIDKMDFKGHKPTENPSKKEFSIENASASDVFSSILENKEKKNRRMQILLTEANFETLTEVSEKTGRSKNDIINRLILTLKENVGL